MLLQIRKIHIYIGTIVLSGLLTACISVVRSETTKQFSSMVAEQTPTAANTQVDGNEPIEQTPTNGEQMGPRKLVWQDEFNDSHLDKANWIAEVNDWGGGNKELQYYTGRSKNVSVVNGLLEIVGRKEPYLTRDYTSARLTSTRSWTYGRFEVKAKLPEGRGIWPAIWLRSVGEPYGSWPASGEIDIMEMLGDESTVTYGTLHYGFPSPHDELKQGSTILLSQGFHVFALEWEKDEIRWYVDDVNYFTADSWYTSGGTYPAPFDQPFNIILNLAIGGTWPGNPDQSTLFPQKLLIDYVRVYQ